jgi:hypothetical protein
MLLVLAPPRRVFRLGTCDIESRILCHRADDPPVATCGTPSQRRGDSATFCVTSPEGVAEVSVIPLPTARRPVALVVAVDAFLDRFRDDPATRATYTETLRRLRETAGIRYRSPRLPRRSTSRR